MRVFSPLAVGLALAATAATANAQTVISRQVTEGLIETLVIQDIYGNLVTTSRVLAGPGALPAPVAVLPAPAVAPVATWPAPVTYYDPAPAYPAPVTYAPPVYTAPVQRVVEVDTVTTRRYVRPTARAVARQYVVRRNAPIVARAEAPVRRVQRAVLLTPAEQRIVYRTVVQQVPAAPVVRDAYWRPPILAQDDVVTPASVVYPVGAVMPTGVPLYGVPQPLAFRVPAAQPYSLAYVGGRVYLVDPVTSVIVADVTQY